MTFVSRTQFHIERPWGQRPSRGLLRDCTTGCGSFYSTNEDLYCEDSGEDNLGYSDHDTAEDFSDREPEIVCGGAVAPAAGSRAGRGRGRGSRAWDLSVVILALCVAIIFGYYSVM